MSDSSSRQGDGGVRIPRRAFIGASLAGAGAALIAPESAFAGDSHPQTGHGRQSASRNTRQAGSSKIPFLPTRSVFPHLPAIPVDLEGMVETLVRLAIRQAQTTQAKQGLTNRYTIQGRTDVAYAFLFGEEAAAASTKTWEGIQKLLEKGPQAVVDTYLAQPLSTGRVPLLSPPPGAPNPLSLDSPEQFSMSWTTYPDVYRSGLNVLPAWASSLNDADSATEQFWPMIAQHGFAYNLILPEKVTRAKSDAWRRHFGAMWGTAHDALAAAGNLYVIDMSRFQALQAQSVHGAPRFTPSTVTLLEQNPRTKALTPIAVTVSGYHGQHRQLFTRANSTDGAWLYALQAAKASIAVFGVWLGHVYHWHLVTTAMQATMFNTFPTDHAVYQLLAPQSKYAMAFDDVLLLLWQFIAPPTSLSDFLQFLSLSNDYAAGRSYFDDDPKVTLKALGLEQSDFTIERPWDQYPVVQRLLTSLGSGRDVCHGLRPGDVSLGRVGRRRPTPSVLDRRLVPERRRKHPRSAGDEEQGSAPACAYEFPVSSDGTRYFASDLDCQSRIDLHRQFPPLSSAHRHSQAKRSDRYENAADLPA